MVATSCSVIQDAAFLAKAKTDILPILIAQLFLLWVSATWSVLFLFYFYGEYNEAAYSP